MNSPPRVLAIDDEKLIRMSLSLALEREGYVVDTASCGTEAMRLLDRFHYDLILTDLRLPDISGYEILHYALGRDAGAKVLLVTASSNAPSPAEAAQAGALGILQKPFTLAWLAQEARRVIENGIAQPSAAASGSTMGPT